MALVRRWSLGCCCNLALRAEQATLRHLQNQRFQWVEQILRSKRSPFTAQTIFSRRSARLPVRIVRR